MTGGTRLPQDPHCQHAWRPLLFWYGRYACTKCGVFGYRALVTGDYDKEDGPLMPTSKRPEEIVPYICRMKGCTLGATSRHKGKGQYCREHTEHREEMIELREQESRDRAQATRERVKQARAKEAPRKSTKHLTREERRARLRAKGFKLVEDKSTKDTTKKEPGQ